MAGTQEAIPAGSGPGERMLDRRGIALLGGYLVTAALAVMLLLWRQFPSCEIGGVLVTRLDPDKVSTRGDRFRILGEGFEGGARVVIAGGPPITASVLSPFEITVTAGAHAPGNVDVIVLQGDSGAAATPGGLTYLDQPPAPTPPATPPQSSVQTPAPTSPTGSTGSTGATGPTGTTQPGAAAVSISEVRPATASIVGGEQVTITGTGFTSDTRVWFGGTPARRAQTEGTQFIIATTPRHTSGPVDVVIGNERQVLAVGNKFSFVCPSVPDRTMVLLVLFAGALGALVHAIRSFFWYVGQRDLRRCWVPMYLLLPFTGGTLGFLFYLIIRAGLYQPQGGTSFLLVGLSALVGMFSAEAAQKLKDVAGGVFTTLTPGANASPPRASSPPAVSVGECDPKTGPAAGGTPVTIKGSGFAASATVRFGQTGLTPVTFVDASNLKITTPAGQAGAVDVEVTVAGTTAKQTGAFTYT